MARYEVAKELAEKKKGSRQGDTLEPPAPLTESIKRKTADEFPIRLKNGHILQTNQANIPFIIRDDDNEHQGMIIIELGISKYIDTTLLDIDVKEDYIRCVVKNKLVQLELPSSIDPNLSKVQRCTISGALIISMYKKNHNSSKKEPFKSLTGYVAGKGWVDAEKEQIFRQNQELENRRKKLNATMLKKRDLDNIISDNFRENDNFFQNKKSIQMIKQSKALPDNWTDDMDVPPLEDL